MVYSITFDLKNDNLKGQKQNSRVIWAKCNDDPPLDKVYKLVERLFGDDVDTKTIRVVKGGEEWDEKEVQKGARLYDLDQE
jgi:hypothetical protein